MVDALNEDLLGDNPPRNDDNPPRNDDNPPRNSNNPPSFDQILPSRQV